MKSFTVIQKKVMALIKATELEYAQFVYEEGILYLHEYLHGDKVFADIISRSAIFWQWWKMQWEVRDLEFISVFEKTASAIDLRNIRSVYYMLNSGKEMAGTVHPQSCILEESYHKMMELIIQNDREKHRKHPQNYPITREKAQ